MKKINTNKDRLANLEERGNLIKESFKKEFDKIKRVDESNRDGGGFGKWGKANLSPEEKVVEEEYIEGSFGTLQYRGGDGMPYGPDSWAQYKGMFTTNNGCFGWVTPEGELKSVAIPRDAVQLKKIHNYFKKNGYSNNSGVPVNCR